MIFCLGTSADGRAISTVGAANPHIFVDGCSGGGKSFALRSYAEQVALQGGFVIIFDYSCDWRNYQGNTDITCQRLDVMDDALKFNPLAPVASASSFVRAQRLVNMLLAAYRLGNRACVDLLNSTQQYLDNCSSSPSIQGLLTHIWSSPMTKGLVAVEEPLTALSQLIRCGDTPTSIDISNPGILVLDWRQLESFQLRKLLIEIALRSIWDTKINSASSPPLIILLDECQHLYWSEQSMATQILREGRKFDIAGWFATQWLPNKTAETAVRQAATHLHFRQDADAARALSKRLAIGKQMHRDRYYQRLISLRPGEFVFEDSAGHIRFGRSSNNLT